MTITGDYLLIALILLALGLTIASFRVGLILFRMAAAISWLVLGILFWTNQLGTSIADPWTQALGFVFLLMAIAVLTLQIRTDIRHEKSVRGKVGYPGAEQESWTTWGPKPGKNKTPTAQERQDAHRAEVRSRLGRK